MGYYPYYYGYTYPYYGYDYTYSPGYSAYDDTANINALVQRELAREGYYHGPIDGQIGPVSQSAIAAYQRDNGLKVTGGIDGNLLSAMDLD